MQLLPGARISIEQMKTGFHIPRNGIDCEGLPFAVSVKFGWDTRYYNIAGRGPHRLYQGRTYLNADGQTIEWGDNKKLVETLHRNQPVRVMDELVGKKKVKYVGLFNVLQVFEDLKNKEFYFLLETVDGTEEPISDEIKNRTAKMVRRI
jgi:hypothetical protein